MNFEDDPKCIKYYVKQYLLKNAQKFKDKVIVDFPAGNGVTSNIIMQIGAKPVALDLFPEYFKYDGIECLRANINDRLPLKPDSADMLICQEGLEHFSDQLAALKEFNRILKKGGKLLLTVPNYSSLRSKISYLFFESERVNALMPPNEIDSIWMLDTDITAEVYYGHIFLIGVQKLRLLAKLAGFKIKKIYYTRFSTTSLLLFPFLYPFVFCASLYTYLKNATKKEMRNNKPAKSVYLEQFKLGIMPKILIDKELFVEFIKDNESREMSKMLKSRHDGFNLT